jgi:SpoVK/Ycf46/Vps4 family AAA+-type ATPase
MIDPAMLRPGRLDTLIEVPLPNPQERADILETVLHGREIEDLDVSAFADKMCDGFSGADLALLVKEASLTALVDFINSNKGDSEKPIKLLAKHFHQAVQRVKPSVINA